MTDPRPGRRRLGRHPPPRHQVLDEDPEIEVVGTAANGRHRAREARPARARRRDARHRDARARRPRDPARAAQDPPAAAGDHVQHAHRARRGGDPRRARRSAPTTTSPSRPTSAASPRRWRASATSCCPKIKALLPDRARRPPPGRRPGVARPPPVRRPPPRRPRPRLPAVVPAAARRGRSSIGCSTGGPEALATAAARPARPTCRCPSSSCSTCRRSSPAMFAQRLDAQCALRVREAARRRRPRARAWCCSRPATAT